MKLEPAQQQIIDDLIAEADAANIDQAGAAENRVVAEHLVAALDDLEGSGRRWVADYIKGLTVSGAMSKVAEWRRRYEIKGTTKKGTKVTAPAYGAVRSIDEDGTVRFLQMRLEGMSVVELQDLKSRKARMRDTLSAEIKFYDALIETMEERKLATAGEALDLLGAA